MTANRSIASARQVIRSFGTCLKFIGSGQTVELGTANPFTGSFYFSTWFNWSGANGAWQQLFNKRDSYLLADLLFSMSFAITTNELVIDTIAGSINWGYYPRVGEWTHLIWVHDTSANTDNLYINGILFASTAKRTLGNDTAALISIGAAQSPATESFNGYLDETAIGTTTLTAQQAYDIYCKSIFPSGSLWTLLKYDEGSGSTATDSSGSGHNGTIISATYATNLPPFGTARSAVANRFKIRNMATCISGNGTNAYIRVTNAASINPLQFTIAFWAYKNSEGSNFTRFAQKGNNATKGYLILQNNEATAKTPYISMRNTAGTAFETKTQNSRMPIKTWRHLAWTFDGSVITPYENAVAKTPVAFTGVYDTVTDFLYILQSGASANYGDFRLEDFQIYSTALTSNQINRVYYDGVYGSNNVLWHKYDEGSGSTATDSSGNGNTGTITNATYVTTNLPFSGTRTAI